MHRVLEAEQIELLYDCAERCKRCKEITCKQPAYVEVVYCPRFVAIEPHPNSVKRKLSAIDPKKTDRITSTVK